MEGANFGRLTPTRHFNTSRLDVQSDFFLFQSFNKEIMTYILFVFILNIFRRGSLSHLHLLLMLVSLKNSNIRVFLNISSYFINICCWLTYDNGPFLKHFTLQKSDLKLGIYIMRNTMSEFGGKWPLGNK